MGGMIGGQCGNGRVVVILGIVVGSIVVVGGVVVGTNITTTSNSKAITIAIKQYAQIKWKT